MRHIEVDGRLQATAGAVLDPKIYVEIQFETQTAANAAVEQLNGVLKDATGLEFGEDA
jgi:hypothetical protein